MLIRVKRIAPLQLGKLLAVVYGLFSIMYIPIMLLASIALPEGKTISLLVSLVMPIFHIVTAFVGGIVGAFFYNFASKRLGGIVLEFEKEETIYFS